MGSQLVAIFVVIGMPLPYRTGFAFAYMRQGPGIKSLARTTVFFNVRRHAVHIPTGKKGLSIALFEIKIIPG